MSYTQHGRRHGPNGSDPIPGLLNIERELLGTGGATTIADNDSAALAWAKDLGDDLLDLTDPTLPTAVADGVYAVTVLVIPQPLTVAGFYVLTVELDPGGDGAFTQQTSVPSTAGNTRPVASCGLTYFVPAGGQIVAQVLNHDGSASRDFDISLAVVQRIA